MKSIMSSIMKNAVYVAYSIGCLGIVLLAQQNLFRRIDYDFGMLLFIAIIVRLSLTKNRLINCVIRVLSVYFSGILLYLLIHFLGRHIYTYPKINGYANYFELFVIIPFLSMSLFHLALQSVWFIFDIRVLRKADGRMGHVSN